MMNYTVPGGRFNNCYVAFSLNQYFAIGTKLVGKCNRGLMVEGSLRHLIKEREKVSGHHRSFQWPGSQDYIIGQWKNYLNHVERAEF
jgi:hypothetical protein